jgi:hypothetical protein
MSVNDTPFNHIKFLGPACACQRNSCEFDARPCIGVLCAATAERNLPPI